MNDQVESVTLWRRLDAPGHDAAALVRCSNGAEIHGAAVFREHGSVCALAYRVACDPAWRTTATEVDGWCDGRPVGLRIRRTREGHWWLNERTCPEVIGCDDVDLSFTPATNLLPIRRLALRVGAAAEVRAAWLAWPEAALAPITQRYARRSAETYDYEADVPGQGRFAAVLRVGPESWVLDYGDLWRADRSG
jgi:hypothetical protein